MKKREMHRYAKPAAKQVVVRARESVIETLRQDSFQSVRLSGSASDQPGLVELLTGADLFLRRGRHEMTRNFLTSDFCLLVLV